LAQLILWSLLVERLRLLKVLPLVSLSLSSRQSVLPFLHFLKKKFGILEKDVI